MKININITKEINFKVSSLFRKIKSNITFGTWIFVSTLFLCSLSTVDSNEDENCCGDDNNVSSNTTIEFRDIPNLRKSIGRNRYGPYELDFSNENPRHAFDPISKVEEKDMMLEFKHQKGKVLIKINSNWAIGRNFWHNLEFPGVQKMIQLFPNSRDNKKITKMSTILPEGGQSKPDLWRWFEAELIKEETVIDVIKNLRGRPEIDKIEPVYIYSTKGPVYSDESENENIYKIQELPSKDAKTDPEWKGDSLYHIDALNVPNAWKYLEKRQATNKTPGGSPDVIIAILDTGVDYNHEDLKSNMWVNAGEIAGNNIDDDKNGFIDDVNGVNVVSNKESHSGDPMDFNGHGTHCAGIAAAAASNDKGIVGVAYGCKIMAIKSGQYAGIFSTTDIAEGIYYAIENGADIINMSLGGPDSEVVRDALSVAFGDIVLIAAAGNSGRANEYPCPGRSPSYPAAHNWVLGVEAREKYLQAWGWRAKFSNYDCIPYTKYEYEVMAPGVSIYSTWPGGGYASLDGTSMAAPTIAGMAGLLRTQWPKSKYSSRFIMGQIIGSPSNQPRVPDALMALSSVPTPKLFMKEFWLFDSEDVDVVNDNDGVVDAGETIDLALVIRNQWGKATDIKVKVEPIAKIEEGGGKLKDQAAYKKDQYVEMITEEVSYDPLGSFNRGDNKLLYDSGGAIIGVQMPFKFKVNENTPNDHFIPFRVTLTARNGYDDEDTESYVTQQRFQVQVQNGSEIPTIVSSDLTLTKDKFWIAVRPILIEKGATVTVEAGTQIQLGGPDPKTVYRDPFGRAFIQVEGKFETKGTHDSVVSIFPAPFWMPSPYYGGKGQNSVIRVRGDGVFNMKYTEVMNPEVKGDKFDHVRFRYDIANNNPFYIRATELMYTECDLIIPTVVSMDTCLISRTRGSIRPGGLWYDEEAGFDPRKESRFGGRMNNSVILGHMVNMDYRYSPKVNAYQDMPHELFKGKKFTSIKHYKDKTYAVIYPRTWLFEPGELTSVRGWNKLIEGKDSYETFYSKSALKTASLVANYFGGEVLKIDDVNENVFIANYIKDVLSPNDIAKEVIIPLSDLDYDNNFNWLDGQSPIFTNWGDGFPTSTKGGYFVKVNSSGIWSNSKWINTTDSAYLENGPSELQAQFRYSDYNRIHVGWYGTDIRSRSWKFKGELPTIIELPGIKTKENLDAEYSAMHAKLSSDHHAVQNNAFLSSTWDPNTGNLIRIVPESPVYGYHSGDSERDIDYTGNYWGPVADKRINAMIHDGVDYGTGQKIIFKPRLNPEVNADHLKMSEIWPFVVDIKITTDELKRESLANVPDVGMGTAIFEILFNRDMDVSKPLRANFGPDDPFTDYPIRPYGDNNGWQKDLRTWIGTFNITPVTGDGYQMVRTYKAVAKSDPWLESGRDTGRFRFTINTVSIESLNLQVNSAEGANKLIWVQRDFDMLAGFNMYRSATKDGNYKKINRALIPKNKRSYLDKQVASGSKYFYKFTVVDTAGVESAFSNLDDGVPIKIVLPSIKHTPVVSGDVLNDINLDAQVTDNVTIENVSVYYRLMGLENYKKLTANKIDGNLPGYLRFNAKIPGIEVLSPGVEYYIEVFDGVNDNSHGTPDNPNKVILKNTLYLSYLEPNTGSYEGGTKITLTGMNFESGIEVYFGMEKATDVAIKSSTELTCKTPKYFPSYVDVRVENKSRQISRLTSGFGFTSPKVDLSLSDRKVALNRSVVVPLDIGAFSGLSSLDATIFYNSNELIPLSVKVGDLISKWSFTSNFSEKGKILVSAASPSGTISGAGNLCNIEFKAIGTPGKITKVNFGGITLNEGAIPYNTVDGTVSIASSEDTKAIIEISNLKHVYDGSPKSASISVSVSVDQTIVTYSGKTYNGAIYEESKTPPTEAGLYTVKARVFDKKYTGEKEEFLEINKAPVTLKLSNLLHYKDGSSKKPEIITNVEGLLLNIKYKDSEDNALAEAPSNEGVYNVEVTVNENNYQGTAYGNLTIQKIIGAITLDNLSQSYDGSYKPVKVITNPSGVDMIVKYDGFEVVPINAGSYSVTAEFDDSKYKGTATGTLIIRKKEAVIDVTNLIQDYDGSKKSVKIDTIPSGLNYTVQYDEVDDIPFNYGSYKVRISINESNYQGEILKTLIIKKPDAKINLSKLARVYTGNESPIGVEIVPSALKYNVTYNGLSEVPVDPGRYTVNVKISDETYQGEANAELVITKAVASIQINDLTQIYDGKSKKVNIITEPPGIQYIVKYNGSDLQPITSGAYDTTVTLNDHRYQASQSETLVISKRSALINFTNLIMTETGEPHSPIITTDPKDLDLTVKYTKSDGEQLASAPKEPGIYKVIAEINEINYKGTKSEIFRINAQDPFGEPVAYPQNSAILLGLVDISGSPAPDGDVVGAYVGNELRAKQQIVTSEGKSFVTLTISVLQEGERLRLKLWRRETDVIIDFEGEFSISPAKEIGNALDFPNNLAKLSFGGSIDQSIALKKGWNLVSFSVIAEDMSPVSVFKSVKDSLITVKDITSIYNPAIPEFLNTLKKITLGSGYWVNMKEDKILTISGSMPKEITIDLNKGWNLIGYPDIKSKSPEDIFKDVKNELLTVKNISSVYNPKLPSFLNTLKLMQPGVGYWVNMKNKDSITFNQGDGGSRNISKANDIFKMNHNWGLPVIYPNIQSTVYGSISTVGFKVSKNDYIGAFVNGEFRGYQSPIIVNSKAYVALNINMAGEELVEFKYYDISKNTEYRMSEKINMPIGGQIGENLKLAALQFQLIEENDTGNLKISNDDGVLYIQYNRQESKYLILQASSNLKNWIDVEHHENSNKIYYNANTLGLTENKYFRVKVLSR